MAHAETLTAIDAIRKDAKVRDFCLVRLRDCRGFVSRAVVNHDDFRIGPSLPDISCNFFERVGQPLLSLNEGIIMDKSGG